MPLPEIEEILIKYKQEELKIEKLLEQIETGKVESEEKFNSEGMSKVNMTLEEAKDRNSNILKDLETVKGNLRSKAIFSPAEMQWEDICRRYREEPSLPVTTWKCHLPVFV